MWSKPGFRVGSARKGEGHIKMSCTTCIQLKALLLSHKKEWKDVTCNNKEGHRGDRKWSTSERQTNTIWYHVHVESKIWHKWIHLQNRNRLTDLENTLVVAKGEGEGWIGSLGLADANDYYIENGWTTRFYCRAQETIFNILRKAIMEMNHVAV